MTKAELVKEVTRLSRELAELREEVTRLKNLIPLAPVGPSYIPMPFYRDPPPHNPDWKPIPMPVLPHTPHWSYPPTCGENINCCKSQ